MDMADVFPVPELFLSFVRLGRVPGWFSYTSGPDYPDGMPRTDVHIDWDKARTFVQDAEDQKLFQTLRSLARDREHAAVIVTEAVARLMADGPKLFRPTEEQFESMEHVELRLPIAQFRAPYPAFVVRIPAGARARLVRDFGLAPNRVPSAALVRTHAEPDRPVMVCVNFHWADSDIVQLFQDQPSNPDIETAISRRIEIPPKVRRTLDPTVDHEAEHRATVVLCRAILNLCLFMTHYGHRIGEPVDPHAWTKHRAKKHLRHLACRDFLAVEMKQDIVVRAHRPPTNNPPGPGTGIQVDPHWVIGHWRAYPGQAAKRWAGEQVPLLFVRPYIVWRDRIVGELSDTEVVYHG